MHNKVSYLSTLFTTGTIGAQQAQKGNWLDKPLNLLIASAGSAEESMPVNEMPGYHFPQNQIGTVVSTHSSGSSPLAGEDRIHSIQQLSVMWEKNQCVREKLLRSPRRRCRSDQRHCGAAGRTPEPSHLRASAHGVHCDHQDNSRDSWF